MGKKALGKAEKTVITLYGDKAGFEAAVAREKKAQEQDSLFREIGKVYAELDGEGEGEKSFSQFCAEREVHCALVRALEKLRVFSNLSPYALSKRGTISYGKIARMECWDDDKLNLGNVKAYLAGLGYRLRISFEKIPAPKQKSGQ